MRIPVFFSNEEQMIQILITLSLLSVFKREMIDGHTMKLLDHITSPDMRIGSDALPVSYITKSVPGGVHRALRLVSSSAESMCISLFEHEIHGISVLGVKRCESLTDIIEKTQIPSTCVLRVVYNAPTNFRSDMIVSQFWTNWSIAVDTMQEIVVRCEYEVSLRYEDEVIWNNMVSFNGTLSVTESVHKTWPIEWTVTHYPFADVIIKEGDDDKEFMINKWCAFTQVSNEWIVLKNERNACATLLPQRNAASMQLSAACEPVHAFDQMITHRINSSCFYSN